MPIKCAPREEEPTHHISLRDRAGRTIGLILCDSTGKPITNPVFRKVPIDRTALKTTSGNSTYSDFDPPYSPIVQDDWSGGRGNLDFERDSTKYYDGFRVRTGRSNKAFLGPQEQYTKGYRSQDYSVPGNVYFHSLIGSQRRIAKRFQASASYTVALAWILAMRKASPNDLTIAVHNDNSGDVGTLITSASVAVPSTRMPDIMSEWLNETLPAALTSTTYYWIIVYGSSADTEDSHWRVAVKAAAPAGTTRYSADGTTWYEASYDLYFRLTDANAEKDCLFYSYKEQQYKIVNSVTGAPKLYMNGDRGAADSNSGTLNKLIDGTKSWVTDEWIGCVCKIIDGPGRTESKNYRIVTSNSGSELVFDEPWLITHTTTTEYVILGSDKWTEIGTGSGYGGTHGITAPVTSVLETPEGILYLAMGTNQIIRRHREYNNAGTWTSSDWSDDTASKYADFLIYKPQEIKIYRAENSDTNGNVSVSSASPNAWGNLTWGTEKKIGSKHRKITGLQVYPDDNGDEALWVHKVDMPWIVPNTGNPIPFALREMENVRDEGNGKTSLVHNVYHLFTLGNGLQRYYGGNLDDIGPNLGEGLPTDRQGMIIELIGYPGRFFAVFDGGADGYSSVMDRDGNGWHERYRAPKGQRLLAAAFQPIPGSTPDRMWIYQGNDSIWIPFPSNTTNELDDENYLYTHEGALILSRAHAGMFDVQKLCRIIKLQSENLEKDVCWIELDYRLNEETEWTTIASTFTTSPTQEIDLIEEYGLAFRRLQVRIRFYTTDASQTPILLAIIVEAVMRTSVKYQYPITFRLMDNEPTLTFGEQVPDDIPDPMEKLSQLEAWSDDSTDSMLYMSSISPLFHNKMVFLNPITTTQVTWKPNPSLEDDAGVEVYVCMASFQEA